MTPSSTSFECGAAGFARIAALLLGLAAGGCLEKGDTTVAIESDAARGVDPGCVNVCGRVTADDPSWGGCGLFGPKERGPCTEACEAANAGVAVWRCVMDQPDCDSFLANCDSAF